MSITFETPTADDIQAGHDAYWAGALAGLNTPQIGDEKVSPVSRVLPYFAAQRALDRHVNDCEACGTGSWFDLCPEGNALSTIAADACAAQEDLAVQN